DAGTYTLSFQAAQRGPANRQVIRVLVDGSTVGVIRPQGSTYAGYVTASFTVTQGTHVVSFVGLNPFGGDNTAFIDQVGVGSLASVADPGFETPNVGAGSYQYDPSGSPWTFSGMAGVSGNGSWFTAGNPNAPEASQVAILRTTGNISQQVTFAAGTYAVTFQATHRANENSGWADPGGVVIRLFIHGSRVGSFYVSGTAYTTEITNAFTVGAGSHTLTFVSYNPFGGDHTAFLDQVRITPPDRLQGLLADPGLVSVADSLL